MSFIQDKRAMEVKESEKALQINLLSNDWRTKCDDVSERWVEARKRKFLTDVDFLVGEGEKAKSFSAHKIVLAVSSPVFEIMFYGASPNKNNPVAVTDVDPEVFEELLRHVYGESTEISSLVKAAKVYLAADKYLMTNLKDIVTNTIQGLKINDQQFWDITVEDKFFQIPSIKDICLDYFSKNTLQLFDFFSYSKVSSSVAEEILLLNKMEITESELLSTVVHWAVNNTDSEMKLKEKLRSILPHIRFATFTTEEYFKFLSYHPGLIDDKDSLDILKHLLNPSTYKLPSWCSSKSESRKVGNRK